MKDMQFRVLLDLMMVIDPWPLSDVDHRVFIQLLRNEAKAIGYDDEIAAYHNFLQLRGTVPKALPTKKRKPRKARGSKSTGA